MRPDVLTPARRAAWNRYYNAKIDVLSAGAMLAQLLDAYEELERSRAFVAELRREAPWFCEADRRAVARDLRFHDFETDSARQ